MKEKKYAYEIKLVWIFLFLLLFEGILRKWLLPNYSTPIIVVKQLLAIYMIFIGVKKGLIHSNWAFFSIILGWISFITTLLFGHQNLYIAIWGCMNWWFGIPLCIFIGNIIDRKTNLKMLWCILYFSIINGIVTSIQYFSPTTSLINMQVGGEIGANGERFASYSIADLAGMYRCYGIFAHTTQSSIFMPLALGSVLYFFLFHKRIFINTNTNYKLTIVLISLFTYILTCAFSVSRSIIFITFLSLTFILSGSFPIIRTIKKLPLYLMILIIICLSSLFIPAINKGVQTLTDRFTSASSTSNTFQGNINDMINRGIIYTFDAVINPKTLNGEDVPFWGYGQGLSTQVGGRLAGIKKHSGFALAEWDSKRIICESGLYLGLLILFCRLGFVLSFFPKIVRNIRCGNYLPLFIYPSFFFAFFFLSTWGNSFVFNFSLLCSGLCIASINNNKSW